MTFKDYIIKKINKRKLKLLRKISPPPFKCRHSEYSILSSLDDEPHKMSERLLNISLEAIKEANKIDLSGISQREPEEPNFPDVWPGEHYKLLAALVKTIKPKLVIEVGTALGHSALALKKFLPNDSKLITFDIFEWDSLKGTLLNKNDFSDGNLVQEIGDLAQDKTFDKYKELISEADFIFIDAPKDIAFERELLKKMDTIQFKNNPIIMFDDIRLWNMLKIWREIKKPKLDLTSFGHWSGTGLIDWNSDLYPTKYK